MSRSLRKGGTAAVIMSRGPRLCQVQMRLQFIITDRQRKKNFFLFGTKEAIFKYFGGWVIKTKAFNDIL